MRYASRNMSFPPLHLLLLLFWGCGVVLAGVPQCSTSFRACQVKGTGSAEFISGSTNFCDKDGWRQHDACWDTCVLSVLLTAPPHLAGVRVCGVPDGFLPFFPSGVMDEFHPLNGKELEVAVPDVATGCRSSDYSANSSYEGKLVFVRRGACWFWEKFDKAYKRGAKYGVLVNTVNGEFAESNMWSMSGNRESFSDMPAMMASQHWGNAVLEAVADGLQVRARVEFACGRPATPSNVAAAEVVRERDNCPSPAVMGVCAQRPDLEDRLCTKCPLSFAFQKLRTCLWPSRLLPRVKENLFWGGGAAFPVGLELTMLPSTFDSCNRQSYAALSSTSIVLEYPALCIGADVARYAASAGVSAVVFLPNALQRSAPRIEGASQLSPIPIHVITVEDKPAFVESFTRYGRVGSILFNGVPVETRALSGAIVDGLPIPTPAVAIDGVPALPPAHFEVDNVAEINGVMVTFMVLGVLSLAAIVGIFIFCKTPPAPGVQYETANDPPPVGLCERLMQVKVPLRVASIALSVSLILIVTILVFILVMDAANEATDTAIAEGEAATHRIYASATANVGYLSNKMRNTVMQFVATDLQNSLRSGEALATVVKMQYYETDNSWESFFGVYTSLVDVIRNQEQANLRFTGTVLTTNNLFANVYQTTDYRPDAQRPDSHPHVSKTQDGRYYGLLGHLYNPALKRNIPLASSLMPEAPYGAPFESIGTWPGDPHTMTRGKPDGYMQWHFQTTAFPFSNGFAGTPSHPLSVYTPLYNRSLHYLGTVESYINLARLESSLRSTVTDTETLENMTMTLVEVGSSTVLATTGRTAAETYPAFMTGRRRSARQLLPIQHLTTIETNAAFYKFGAQDTFVVNEDGLLSGTFDQADYYRDPGWVKFHLKVHDGRWQDVSGAAFDTEAFGGCGDCIRTDAATSRAVLRVEPEGSVLVYRNLTTDAPLVAETALSQRPWRSSHPMFQRTRSIGRGRFCVTEQAITTTWSGQETCCIREALFRHAYSLVIRFRPDTLQTEAASTPHLFKNEEASPIPYFLVYSTGRIIVGGSSFKCETPSVPGGIKPEWTTIVVVVNSQCTVYVNGVLHSRADALRGSRSGELTPMVLGGNGFSGLISDVVFLNRSLTDGEAARIGRDDIEQVRVRDVPREEWFYNVAAIQREDSTHAGIHLALLALLPRDDVMRNVDHSTAGTLQAFESQQDATRKKLRLKSRETLIVVVAVSAMCVLVFLVFNDRLTRPFSAVAVVMTEASVMCTGTGGLRQHSSIAELDTMYQAMHLMVDNLRAFRPFLPDALFSPNQCVPHRPEREEHLPPGARAGMVAIVFTDIVSSTEKWARAPGCMREALAVHNRVVRTCIVEADGYEVKTIGDSFLVAFDTATQACTFGLRVQEELYRAEWPPGLNLPCSASVCRGGLPVRIGVNFGHAELDTNPVTQRSDYFGNVVNAASRIESVGVEGAVTVSWEVLEEVRLEAELSRQRSTIESLSSSVGQSKDQAGGRLDFPTLGRPATLPLPGMWLRGLERPLDLFVLVPDTLEARVPAVRGKVETLRKRFSSSAMGQGQGQGQVRPPGVMNANPLSLLSESTFSTAQTTGTTTSGSSAFSFMSASRRAAADADTKLRNLNRKANATMAKTEITTLSFASELADASSRISEPLLRVMASLERTEGSVVSVVGTAVYSAWNTLRPCAGHSEQAYRFVKLLRNARPDAADVFNVGAAAGTVIYGSVGTQVQKFITTFGPCVSLSNVLSLAAHTLRVVGLYCSVVPGRENTLDIFHNARPIDTITLKKTVEESIPVTVYELRTPYEERPILCDGAIRELLTSSTDWGWSPDYKKAYAERDHQTIDEQSVWDHTLAAVALSMRTGNPIVTSPRFSES
eukprot:Rhum_TRINITY_DN8215_c0_g1::Rhum_TRINITY_DN8215_c0_g1_i1::g.26790::m.26790